MAEDVALENMALWKDQVDMLDTVSKGYCGFLVTTHLSTMNDFLLSAGSDQALCSAKE